MKNNIFRQKRNGCFYYWGYVSKHKSVFIPPKFPKMASFQYIGIKDINGIDIYEDDIVIVDDREIGGKINQGKIYFCTDYTLEDNPCFAGWGANGHFRLSPNIRVISSN